MKRVFLRSLAVLMIACMFILTGGGFVGNDVGDDEGFTEIVIVDVNCCEKEQQIIATLNGEDLISPRSILCLFGHSMAQGTAITIDHRFYATAPRCRQTRHRVDYCTRSSCNYMVLTQTSQSRIHCCA